MKRSILALMATAVLLASAPAAFAQSHGSPPAELVAVDLILVRPLAFAALLAGTLVYIPSALISSLGGNDPSPMKEPLINEPFRYAVERPLGEFGDLLDQ